MMNQSHGWMVGGMGGGMWVWTVLAVLVLVALFVLIKRTSNK